MPNTGSWKAFERKVAKLFGTRRNPLSGGMSGHKTRSDSLHGKVYIESKWLKGQGDAGMAAFSLWEDTVAKAKREGKIPALAMHKRNSRVEFCAIPLELAATSISLYLLLEEYGLYGTDAEKVMMVRRALTLYRRERVDAIAERMELATPGGEGWS
jgi:hypothetical protein